MPLPEDSSLCQAYWFGFCHSESVVKNLHVDEDLSTYLSLNGSMIWGCKLEKMAQEEAEKRADKNDCDAKTYLQSHRSIEINETSKGLATILFVQEEGMHKMVKNLYSDSILHKSTKDLAEIKKIVQEKNRVGCGIGVCSNIKGPVTLYLVCKFNTKK
ncbi:unnamed protein product [Dracunculus medinensis]|uniref:SCP domain-containing protein n=1 Tax=Dracunculus medinensis TaxID=318479 RepID=A0A0N4U6B8_DRAME|nr:unnamed protein product [Dracunculus medinensis]